MTTKTKRTADPISDRLAQIAVAIQLGSDPERFKTELDALLGTEMAERDLDKEQKWEDAYRAPRATEES